LKTPSYFEHTLPNGLKLLFEPVSGVRSAALTLLVPGGTAHEPEHHPGLANLAVSMTTRGAGPYNSRQLMQIQDSLGLQRSENAEIAHASFTVATFADNLKPAIELTSEIVRRPHLPEDQLELCQAGIIQEIESIEDDPAQKVFIDLREKTLPSPLGRNMLGTIESVEEIGIEAIRAFHQRTYEPSEAILGIAGACDFDEIKATVERAFGDWVPSPRHSPLRLRPPVAPIRDHLVSDKVQTHIGIAFDSVPYDHPDFFLAHAAVAILSGGMSSRLWTEVREKRGLCYSVSASYVPLKEVGIVLTHAATTSVERATETLDVILSEVWRLRDGISENEVARVQAGLKSALVMQQESTAARASMLARHWYHLGRVRTVEEISREVDKLTPAAIVEYLDRHPLRELGIVTLGPKQIEVAA